MKKKYNPFKMWGSWVGMILYTILIAGFAGTKNTDNFLFKILAIFMKPFMGNYGSTYSNPGGIFMLLIIPIVGFLIGWGIHSLIRKLRS